MLLIKWFSLTHSQAQESRTFESFSSAGVFLKWTAPGDDGHYGTASAYDLRYSTTYITETSWEAASHFDGEPRVEPAGTVQNCYVSGLTAGTVYYFAMKTVDEAGNWSPLSNVALKVAEESACGDASSDGFINVGDVVFLENYIFHGGLSPSDASLADVNCDGNVNISDVVYLTNYIFRTGSPLPCAACSTVDPP